LVSSSLIQEAGQSGELDGLADNGIAAIGPSPSTTTNTNTNTGNGNSVIGQVSVTRSNGVTQIDSLDSLAVTLTHASNPSYREFTDTVPPTAQALPETGDSGWRWDLREAMGLGTVQAAQLSQLERRTYV
jgi:hypothetical protein